MFSDLKPIDSNLHRTHGWKRQDHYRFAAGDALAPLLIRELPSALPSYPLAFVQRPGGGFSLVAVQGLFEGENLYVDAGGKWRAAYIPSYYRGYPFALQGALIQGERRGVLCFDFDSGLYREAPDASRGEERFFDDAGQVGPLLRKALAFLTQVAEHRRLTDQAVNALSAAQLLVPWTLAVENPNPQRSLQSGLYRVDESRFNALGGPILESLRNANALAIAYAQIFSHARVGVLRQLYDLSRPRPEVAELDLDALFDEGQGDSFKFEWD